MTGSLGNFFHSGLQRFPRLRQSAARCTAQRIGVIEPAGRAVGRTGHELARDGEGRVPLPRSRVQSPAHFEHIGMPLMFRRDQGEFRHGLQRRTQFQPTLGRTQVVTIWSFKWLHRSRRVWVIAEFHSS